MRPIVIVGEAYGAEEERLGKPFVGPSGALLISLLAQSGLLVLTSADRANINDYWRSRNPYFNLLVWEAHPEFILTNVFNLRPQPANDIKHLCGPKIDGIVDLPALQPGKYVDARYVSELDRLASEIRRHAPHLVLALGATPAWALLRTTGIKSIRGAPVYSHLGVKVLPTYHPAAVMRDWTLRPIVLQDLDKAKREAAFPEIRRPQRTIYIEPSIEDLDIFYRRCIVSSNEISEDIETIGDMITCVGFAPSQDQALVVPFYDPTQPDKNYWRTFEEERAAWQWIKKVNLLPKRFIFQNGLFDLHFLWRTIGITCPHATEDTMLLHHALQMELPKSLDFLASIYTNEAKWKFMRKKSGGTLKRED